VYSELQYSHHLFYYPFISDCFLVFLSQVYTKVAVMCGTACYGDYVINVSALGKDETNSDVQR